MLKLHPNGTQNHSLMALCYVGIPWLIYQVSRSDRGAEKALKGLRVNRCSTAAGNEICPDNYMGNARICIPAGLLGICCR